MDRKDAVEVLGSPKLPEGGDYKSVHLTVYAEVTSRGIGNCPHPLRGVGITAAGDVFNTYFARPWSTTRTRPFSRPRDCS